MTVSVDTWRAPVARAALEAGAELINDVSGLSDPELAPACAAAGAALVITHTRVPPKTKAFPDYGDVVADVAELLRERMAEALAAGVEEERIVLDPGIDLAKTPAQSIELLRAAGAGRARAAAAPGRVAQGLRRSLDRAAPGPRRGHARRGGRGRPRRARILRVHDVAGARDYLRVDAALRGGREADTRRARAGAAPGARVKPLTIAQLSDLHCGSPHFVPTLLDRAIVEVNELEPDVVIVSATSRATACAASSSRRPTTWRASPASA